MKTWFGRALAVLALATPLLLGGLSARAAEGEVGITGGLMQVEVQTPDGPVVIKRTQDLEATIQGDFAKTSRKCPPFCIQPMSAAPGVATIGELEMLDILKDGKAKVVDSRTIEWHLKGTIPGAINVPYTEMAMRLNEFGCTKGADKWDCAKADPVVLFCNGPWCGQSPTAIKAMIREGYPADRIQYYRGGMQSWLMLGLTTVEGGF
ncbi:rhodanese-like domain-containing protein [Novispirillum sp. DQ9]|uniref:rhodanese-like domain-containing protein n=1 Tax=Novispirillum sp. DQ9 TaxID=3398612 RepID=UPI003C7ABA06